MHAIDADCAWRIACGGVESVGIGERAADEEAGNCRIHLQLCFAFRKVDLKAIALDMLGVLERWLEGE